MTSAILPVGKSEAVERRSERVDTAYSPRVHEEEPSAAAEPLEYLARRKVADDRAGVREERLSHVVAVLRYVLLRHRTRVLRRVLNRHRRKRHAVLLRLFADNRNRALREHALKRRLYRRRACCAALGLVDLRGNPREGALEIAKCVGADALHLRLLLEDASKRIAKRASSRHLHISMAVLLAGAKLCANRNAVLAADSLGYGADAAAELLERRFDVLYELRLAKRDLGEIDEVRAVVGTDAGKRRRRGKKAGVAAHYDVDLDAAKSPVVEVVAANRARDEPSRRAEAGSVVARAQVVVDRLRDVVDDKRIALLLGLLGDDARGVCGIVAADVEEVSDVQLPKRLENSAAVGGIRFLAAAALLDGLIENLLYNMTIAVLPMMILFLIPVPEWAKNRNVYRCTFLIYATHQSLISLFMGPIRQILYSLFPSAAVSNLVGRILCILLIIAVNMGIHAVMSRFTPRTLKVLTGGRGGRC